MPLFLAECCMFVISLGTHFTANPMAGYYRWGSGGEIEFVGNQMGGFVPSAKGQLLGGAIADIMVYGAQFIDQCISMGLAPIQGHTELMDGSNYPSW